MHRYSGVQRILHWIVALLVLALLISGLFVWFLGFDGVTRLLGEAERDLLYKYHKTFGVIVLGLMAVRLFIRLERGKPYYSVAPSIGERLLAAVVQYLFYIALIVQPILGMLATDALDYPIEFFDWSIPGFIAKDEAMGKSLFLAHGYVGWALVVLTVLHIGGAMKHWLVDRIPFISRMRPW